MAAAALSALSLALFFIGLLAVRNTNKLNPQLQILRKGLILAITLGTIGFGIFFIYKKFKIYEKESQEEAIALRNAEDQAAYKNNLQQLTEKRRKWIIGSWARRDGLSPATVFTFLANQEFYTSDYFEGTYKVATDRIFLYYNDGAADYIMFKRLGPDMLESDILTLIKRPDIVPKKVKVVVSKPKAKPTPKREHKSFGDEEAEGLKIKIEQAEKKQEEPGLKIEIVPAKKNQNENQ